MAPSAGRHSNTYIYIYIYIKTAAIGDGVACDSVSDFNLIVLFFFSFLFSLNFVEMSVQIAAAANQEK